MATLQIQEDLPKKNKDLSADTSALEKEILHYAMDLYASSSLDFVECIIVARHNIADIPVFSFDKKLK